MLQPARPAVSTPSTSFPLCTRSPAALLIVALLGLAGAVTPALAVDISYSGDTTGAATFRRPVENLSALSDIGTAVHYDAYTFTAGLDGVYTFTTTGVFDTFALLYGAPFTPAAGLTGLLAANDDLNGDAFNVSGLSFALLGGQSYVYVVTGFDNDEFGTFSSTIKGPDITPIPEPGSWALLALGLGLGLGLCPLALRRGQRPAADSGARAAARDGESA